MEKQLIRNLIQDTLNDLVEDFLVCDRKEDKYLPVGSIQEAVEKEIISVQEMTDIFNYYLEKKVKGE